MQYVPVIGLEIHTELKTKTKMFCYSLNDPNERHPNVNVCPICMGFPGTLPIINQEAVRKVALTGLALNCRINNFSQFDRKNYFYPDLPKGYQISQYQYPIAQDGRLEISGRKIRIRRIHLEEDTGRLVHDKESGVSLVDYNRSGVPLMEMVTEPDFSSGEEIKIFGEEYQKILRYLEASDADMEKGQMRIEVNLSLRPKGQEEFGTKVEIKNINSFKFAADAADYEIKRQAELLERGEKITHETRGWNEFKKETFPQRGKEETHDYRYFPEPDLPPLEFSESAIVEIKSQLPELPHAKRERFAREYGLDGQAVEVLARDKKLAGYFEAVVSEAKQHASDIPERPKINLEKLAASFLTGDFLRLLGEKSASVDETLVTPENFSELLICVAENKISHLAAKQVLEEMFGTGDNPSDIIERLGLWQISDSSDLEDMARHILAENPGAREDYKKGKAASLQFLVGQVMKESRGRANPKIAQDVLRKLLG